MYLYEETLSHLFGRRFHKSWLAVGGLIVLFLAAKFTPINFSHALSDFGKRASATSVRAIESVVHEEQTRLDQQLRRSGVRSDQH